jgi:hypothetical protein
LTFGCLVSLAVIFTAHSSIATPYVRLGDHPVLSNSFVHDAALQAALPNSIWLVVSSRPSYEQASVVAQSFAATLGPTVIVHARNGSYAVLAGTLFKDKAKPNLMTLKALRLIPMDAFLSSGEGFDQLVSHSYGTGNSTDLIAQTSLITSVRRLQLALTRLKLYTGLTDGLMGPGTVKAFEAYTAAFGSPPGDYLDEYGFNIIEQSAQDGFRSVAERQAARSLGFEDSATYTEALKGGFSTPQALLQAKQRGFLTQQEADAASRAGFETADEFRKARGGGFEEANEYRAASRFRIDSRTDYVAFRSSGFPDKDSFQKARERGFADKTTYERAIAADLKTARAKASVVLDDAQVFIRLNPQIPNLIEVADKASVLGATLPAGTTSNLEQASSELVLLLTPLAGYGDFAVARDKERAEDRGKQVSAVRRDLELARTALTRWVAANISSSKLPEVVQELKLLADVLPSEDLDRLQDAQRSLGVTIAKAGLVKELSGYAGASAESPPVQPGDTTAPFAVTPNNAILLGSASAEVVPLFNASADAPSLVRTLNGGFSFTKETATVCLFGIVETPSIKRGLRAILAPMGARAVEISACTTRSLQRADVLLIGRKAFLEASPSFAVAFVDALEAKKLRPFEPINYAKLAARESEETALVADIAAGVQAGSRAGFGAFEIPIKAGPLCVAAIDDTAAHQEMLKAVNSLVETSQASLVSGQSLEQLYPMILRDECRVVYGSSGSLQQLSQALTRDERHYAFLPIWIENSAVDKAAADLASAKLEKTKQAEAERLAVEEEARMESLRREEEKSQQVVVEAELQKTNGPAATARLTKFTSALKASIFPAQGEPADPKTSSPAYRDLAKWLETQRKDGWELAGVDTAVSDFGGVIWKDRKLDALVTKAELKFRSRERGEYRSECLLFGIVLDDEFEMERDPVASPCADEGKNVGPWKVGHSFASLWRSSPPAVEKR